MTRTSFRLSALAFVIMFCTVLTGCDTDKGQRKQQPLEDVVLAPKTEKVNVPEKTLEPCKTLPRMEERAYTQKETLTYIGTVLTPYSDCKSRQKDGADTMRKAFNIDSK